MFAPDDTIVAIATPRGRGGIGVVRLSGSRAPEIARRLIGRARALAPRRATFARLVDPDRPGAPAVDHVVVTRFVAPRSYTGEDVVEISGHGSPVLLDRVVELARAAGARLAEPGEFTLRAYLHGRMDLVQAEAVADLVDAVTPRQARVAMDQLEGTLTGAIHAVDRTLLDLSARLEASLDFPDEGFHFITREDTRQALDAVAAELDALAAGGRVGRLVREGRLVVIAGLPNAGKSSLFNALLGASRAIVTDVPGTTRDVLTEIVDIGGVPITLVDTAGLSEARDAIEAEGVRRARDAQRVAALTIVVIDRSEPIARASQDVVARAPAPRLVVLSKGDLPAAWTAETLGAAGRDALVVSSATGAGLDRLREAIVAVLSGSENWRDAPAISNIRHLALVDAARGAIGEARAALGAGATEELVLTGVTEARQALEELTGARSADDLLHHVFARFCVGK